MNSGTDPFLNSGTDPFRAGFMNSGTDPFLNSGTDPFLVMAALAWNLKAWFGLLTPSRERGLELVAMEFRRFLHAVILIPCQLVKTARRVIYRLLGYNSWLKDFFATFERIQALELG